MLAITDGQTIIPLPSSQDHKRAFNGDRGPNTGGMGAYSPAPVVTDEISDLVEREIIIPTIHAMKREERPYTGVLYVGVMMTEDGPSVLEFNCRFGDPETQPVLMRLKSDLLPLLHAAAAGELSTAQIEWEERPAVCVVMASGGYPGKYDKGKAIEGLEDVGSCSVGAAKTLDAADLSNSTLSSYDAALTAQHAIGLLTLSENYLKAADSDQNGRVEMIDAAFIARRSVGFPNIGASQVGTWSFEPASFELEVGVADKRGNNFSAMIIGDVNGNWPAANSLIKENSYGFPFNSTADIQLDTIFLTVSVPKTFQLLCSDLWFNYDRSILDVSGVELSDASKYKLIYNNTKEGVLLVAIKNGLEITSALVTV